MTWGKLARILTKTAVLFALCNALFVATNAMDWLNGVSIYNTIVPGRTRLPYSDNPTAAYSLSPDSVTAMFASHTVRRPKADDEFRVLLIGDPGIWGWLLEPDKTLDAALNRLDLRAPDGRRVVVYNLAYPIQAVLKDLMLLDEAMQYEPDAVIWFLTLDGLPRDKQIYPPLVQRNAERARDLIARYTLALDPADERFVETTWWDSTILGSRRGLADWLRLQLFGFSWAATGIDQAIPAQFTPVRVDQEADSTWNSIEGPSELDRADLALDVLAAGAERVTSAGATLQFVNEPIFITPGANGDLRYNSWYPRWAYDAYRVILADECAAQVWSCLDLWDAVPPDEFTNSPVHLSAEGWAIVAQAVGARMASEMSISVP
ncbi:MAG: hypothetical protein IPK19_35095 [Chloroflexi bacterium]|nr:hypothetical protein [Chloroflexota bacterium]